LFDADQSTPADNPTADVEKLLKLVSKEGEGKGYQNTTIHVVERERERALL
jgi:hypothetical protein